MEQVEEMHSVKEQCQLRKTSGVYVQCIETKKEKKYTEVSEYIQIESMSYFVLIFLILNVLQKANVTETKTSFNVSL